MLNTFGTVCALVAAKGNSERVEKKNIRAFADTNLTELKLKQLGKSKNIDRVVLSSESPDVCSIGRKLGVEIHVRDPYFSTSDIEMSEVYKYLAKNIDSDYILWVPVTNPFVETNIYDDVIDIFASLDQSRYDCLLTVTKVFDYIFINGSPANFQPYPWQRSQDLDGTCAMNFAACLLSRKNMIQWGSLVGNNPYFYYLNRATGWDIDFQEDFDYCESVYKQKTKLT